MITPMNNKTIKFNDSKMPILIRNCVVDRDQVKNIKDSCLILEDVPFGIAKNILRHTAIDVQLCKCKDIWKNILCGDEDALIDAYNAKYDCKSDEEIEDEKPFFNEHPEYEFTSDDEPENVEESEEEPPEKEEELENQMSLLDGDNESEEPKNTETPIGFYDEPEDAESSEVEDDEETTDEVEETEEDDTEPNQVPSNTETPSNSERVVRRQVNMNNHKKHRR